MHASRGMDEKQLIVYPKINEIVSPTLTLFPDTSWLLLSLHLAASPFSFFFDDFSALSSSSPTYMFISTTASS